MNKKIMIIVICLFGFLFITATVLFIINKNEENPVIVEEPKEVEPQNSNQYVKIADANLSSSKADVHTLVKYSLGLYAKATDNAEIEGDLLVNFGTINKLTDKENIPINELETNSKEFLNAIIVRYSYDELIIQKDDEVYRFYRIGD